MSNTAPLADQSLVTWFIRFFLLYTAAYLFTRYSQLRASHLGVIGALSYVTPVALSWLMTVTKHVPEPYLDEVFHIPQAQVYCQGQYLEWDDKITTPPGLYITTILLNRLLRLPCSIYNLRAFNVDVVSCISVIALVCRAHLAQTPAKPDTDHQISAPDILTGINIALFPVLFFFSGLYYTDPSSTLVVLLAYANHRIRISTEPPSFLNDVYSLLLGIVALGFRQTNIFWVVIYMGGLEAVHAIKALNPKPEETPKSRVVSEQIKFYAWRYSLGDIHDPPLSLAQPIDIILCVLSIGIAAICNLPTVLRRFLWPHGAILTAFVAFVAWNGGVVLGDKSNHVATLHLAQMLYIWPLFVFFSVPLFIPRVLNLVSIVYQALTSRHASKTEGETKKRTLSTNLMRRRSPLDELFNRVCTSGLASGVLICCGALAAALLIVQFNTIIHPFTLADNRHYMFYVFRYSILKVWWIRYALVPIYVVCAWMCWGALQGSGGSPSAQEKWIQSPFISDSQKTASSVSREASAQSQSPTEAEAGPASPPTSTVLMLLLTTALSLMTAPLVEPRYFILPWVFWRLLVPASTLSPSSLLPKRNPAPSETTALARKIGIFDHNDAENDLSKANNTKPARAKDVPNSASSNTTQSKRSGQSRSSGLVIPIVVLEMFWFLLINVATMYVFVTRPFYWRAPDGTLLEEGRMQRFMW
ncbi:glycosyltransferase family 59 protein [Xylariaceae sp. AK1471]|nr:glycosyltransferase family 59 protein [Xylariaceae sp. AK1471]